MTVLIEFYTCEEWAGFYVNGNLENEGLTIDPVKVAETLAGHNLEQVHIHHYEMDVMWAGENSLPALSMDFPDYAVTRYETSEE